MTKTYILNSAMTRKEIEKATGMTVDYKEHRKSGISIKFRQSYLLNKVEAEKTKNEFIKSFPGCKVTMTSSSNSYFIGARYSVRVIIPFEV